MWVSRMQKNSANSGSTPGRCADRVTVSWKRHVCSDHLSIPSPQTLRRFQSSIPSRRGLPFLGRDAILDQIAAILRDPSTDNVVVLRGQPGVGNTELAYEFARRRHDSYPGGT